MRNQMPNHMPNHIPNPVAARLFFMRRWCAIFLLCLLPLQLSWAAVAAYCGHEVDLQTPHFGHHEHEHEHADVASDVSSEAATTAALATQAADLEQQVDQSLSIDHLDCAQCHAACAGLTLLPGGLAVVIDRSLALASLDGLVRTRAMTPPERPQWLPLA